MDEFIRRYRPADRPGSSGVLAVEWTRRLVGAHYTSGDRADPAPGRMVMRGGSSRAVAGHLRTLYQAGVLGPLGDEQLLERFLAR